MEGWLTRRYILNHEFIALKCPVLLADLELDVGFVLGETWEEADRMGRRYDVGSGERRITISLRNKSRLGRDRWRIFVNRGGLGR